MRPRFEIQDMALQGSTPSIYGIYDHKRNVLIGPAYATYAEAEREAEQLEVERAHTWGTVVVTEPTPTPKLPERRNTVTRTGDIVAHDEEGVTILALRNITVAIPKENILEVVYGTVVRGLCPIRRGHRAGGMTPSPGDVAGWSPERHGELRQAVAGRAVAPWFAEFMSRYDLGRHTRGRTNTGKIIMGANRSAEWLLHEWDSEHPDHSEHLGA